jgi:small subunit ribosomal protein S9
VSKPLVQSTGRRKRAIARVSLREGTGKVTINGRDIVDYLPSELLRMTALAPLKELDLLEKYDVAVTMDGGGIAGQAGALRMGIARALVELDPEARPAMRKGGFLTRDDRKKESKKYGLKKARKAPQYSKR